MQKLLVIGAGGHGCSVAECVLASGRYELVGFLDDAGVGRGVAAGLAVVGTTGDLLAFRHRAEATIVAIGNNALREVLCDRVLAAGFLLASVIHPRAIVSPTAVVGQGSAIMAGAIVGAGARLGQGTIVNSGAVVDHHAQVCDYGHLGVNASMSGGTVLGRGAWMQAGAALGYGVKVADGTVLPPGAALA